MQAGVPDFAPVPGFDGAHQGARVLKYSPNGVRLAMAMDGTVRIYDVQEHSVVLKHELPLPKAVELAFSPRGTYLMTWERPVKTESGAWTKNLSVWDAATGAQLVQFERRQIEGWELQFTCLLYTSPSPRDRG